jgi:hypothetical protein
MKRNLQSLRSQPLRTLKENDEMVEVSITQKELHLQKKKKRQPEFTIRTTRDLDLSESRAQWVGSGPGLPGMFPSLPDPEASTSYGRVTETCARPGPRHFRPASVRYPCSLTMTHHVANLVLGCRDRTELDEQLARDLHTPRERCIIQLACSRVFPRWAANCPHLTHWHDLLPAPVCLAHLSSVLRFRQTKC